MLKTPEESIAFNADRVSANRGEQGADFAEICASVCRLTAALFDVPMAFLSLRDDSGVTPVSAFGISDIEVLDGIAFTERPLVAGEGLLIDDTTCDGRYFLESAVLRAPHMRFYADMPLVHEGEVLGVLAMADTVAASEIPDTKLALFGQFAGQVSTLVALAKEDGARRRILAELQAQQARIDRAADMTGMGYWTIDLATRTVTWSSGLYALMGRDPAQFRPQVATQLDIYRPEDRPGIIEHFQRAVNAEGDFDFEVRIVRPADQVTCLIRTQGGVEYDAEGAPARLCAVVCDISRAKTSASDDFLSHITDDLRAPLNDILAYVRLIETRPVSAAETADYARHLLASAEALQTAVADTVAAEAVESDSEDGVVDVAAVIRETVAAFVPQAEARGTRLGVHISDFDQVAHIDADRVQQVLQNLLSNACKATRDGVISVTARRLTTENQVTRQSESQLHVSVRDTGTGMDAERARAMFAGGRTGRGLGLSIAQTIVEMLGGHIGMSSKPGEGTTVWFEIPVECLAARPDPKATPIPQTLTRQIFDAAPSPRESRPAYAPPRPARPAPVDEDRINREYLRALLADMKLDAQ
ncbi:MAG: ATP-binding protein [Asticcacaulis sp.]|uniref:sensor histidine kinase n=1 Tax=Asticcacaulis sp. TaxID=1872648 RepID=UPI0039E713AD